MTAYYILWHQLWFSCAVSIVVQAEKVGWASSRGPDQCQANNHAVWRADRDGIGSEAVVWSQEGE